MKYIIASKHKSKGVLDDDSGDLSVYTELGWEVMINRLRIIDLLQNKVILGNDTIVTSADRFFLYSKIFKNVINSEVFESLNIAQEFIIDLTVSENMVAFANDLSIWKPEYKNFRRDVELLLKIDTDIICNYNTEDPFVCLLGRFRDWCSYRDSKIDSLNNLINFLNEHKINVFVIGRDAKKNLKNDIPIYVSLQEVCHLMELPSCKFVYGIMSGAMLMAKFCCKSNLIVIDAECYHLHGDLQYNPLFFSSGTNFTQVPIIFYTSDPPETDLLKYL